MKNMTKNIMYIVQELHIFYNHSKYRYRSFRSHQYFHNILQLIYQLIFLYTYNFHNLNILLHHMATSYLHLQLLGFQINPFSHIPLSINSLHLYLYFSLLHPCLLLEILASNLNLYLQVSCHSMCLVLLIAGIRLNTLTFKNFFSQHQERIILHMDH